MKTCFSHPWTLAPAEAMALQRELRAHLILTDRLGPVQRVAGVD
ncbi:MAG: endonuclease V, partial [Candidatus Contendobacter sp.]